MNNKKTLEVLSLIHGHNQDELDALRIARELVQKNIARQPMIKKREIEYLCPNCQNPCGYHTEYIENKPSHCKECGQVLDWSATHGN